MNGIADRYAEWTAKLQQLQHEEMKFVQHVVVDARILTKSYPNELAMGALRESMQRLEEAQEATSQHLVAYEEIRNG